MYFFNSFVVGLPYNSIFCQFWLFFIFKFVVVLLLVVQGGTVCLLTSALSLSLPHLQAAYAEPFLQTFGSSWSPVWEWGPQEKAKVEAFLTPGRM